MEGRICTPGSQVFGPEPRGPVCVVTVCLPKVRSNSLQCRGLTKTSSKTPVSAGAPYTHSSSTGAGGPPVLGFRVPGGPTRETVDGDPVRRETGTVPDAQDGRGEDPP